MSDTVVGVQGRAKQRRSSTTATAPGGCDSCNIAAPAVFHNGGGYDFHFLLRYIATMGSPVCRAPRERPMPMAKAAPKPKAAQTKAKAPQWLVRPANQAGPLQPPQPPSPLQVGREVSVDSMNVFPTSLASMIDDLRACTHKQLPELFPLMASLHPKLQRLSASKTASQTEVSH